MGRIVVLQVPDRYPDIRDLMTNKGIRRHAFVLFFVWYVLHVLNDIINLFMYLCGQVVRVCSWQEKIRYSSLYRSISEQDVVDFTKVLKPIIPDNLTASNFD